MCHWRSFMQAKILGQLCVAGGHPEWSCSYVKKEDHGLRRWRGGLDACCSSISIWVQIPGTPVKSDTGVHICNFRAHMVGWETFERRGAIPWSFQAYIAANKKPFLTAYGRAGLTPLSSAQSQAQCLSLSLSLCLSLSLTHTHTQKRETERIKQ